MGGGLSVQKTDAEKSEFVSYRDDFHKVCTNVTAFEVQYFVILKVV